MEEELEEELEEEIKEVKKATKEVSLTLSNVIAKKLDAIFDSRLAPLFVIYTIIMFADKVKTPYLDTTGLGEYLPDSWLWRVLAALGIALISFPLRQFFGWIIYYSEVWSGKKLLKEKDYAAENPDYQFELEKLKNKVIGTINLQAQFENETVRLGNEIESIRSNIKLHKTEKDLANKRSTQMEKDLKVAREELDECRKTHSETSEELKNWKDQVQKLREKEMVFHMLRMVINGELDPIPIEDFYDIITDQWMMRKDIIENVFNNMIKMHNLVTVDEEGFYRPTPRGKKYYAECFSKGW